MIKSQFILDILDLLLDGDEVTKQAKQQLDYLSDSEYNYTDGAGCYITFSHDKDIFKYKLDGNRIFNGVKIKSTALEIEADATLFLTDGIIDYLEIWSFDLHYPTEELKTYTLKQDWVGSPQRMIIRK